MSRSSISSSNPPTPAAPPAEQTGAETGVADSRIGWRRIGREVRRVLIVLLLLELIVRVGPVHTALSRALAPYENLLWYSDLMPTYRDQLLNGQHYDLWLGGSSYMMTSLQPEWIQADLREAGYPEITAQNYGLTVMRNLDDMAAVFDRWMFEMDEPEYFVLGITVNNFTASAGDISRARNSPMERAFIFRDSLDDMIAGFLYQTSDLYRYTLLARNATFIPTERTILEPKPAGGFTYADTFFEGCDPSIWIGDDQPTPDNLIFRQFPSLDHFIEVVQARGIPIAVVNIPVQWCSLRIGFPSYESYQENYLQPLTDHLEQKGIPFLALDPLFYEAVPIEEQNRLFRDMNHPNTEAAELLSGWTADFLAEWFAHESADDGQS
jgi:hypothetical protein